MGDTVLHTAAKAGQYDIVKTLLKSGVSIDAEGQLGRTPVMLAAECTKPNKNVIECLAACGAQINWRSEHPDPFNRTTATHLCCVLGTVDSLEALIKWRADLNIRNGAGDLPLHRAAAAGRLDIVSCILKHTKFTTSLHAHDYWGRTPIMKAAQCTTPNGKVVCKLVTAGAQVNEVADQADPTNQTTAAHICCELGNHETLKALVDAGADLSLVNGLGELPLHTAVYYGRQDIVPWLLEICPLSSIKVKNKNSETYLDIAKKIDHKEVVALIDSYIMSIKQSIKSIEEGKSLIILLQIC